MNVMQCLTCKVMLACLYLPGQADLASCQMPPLSALKRAPHSSSVFWSPDAKG